MILKEKEKWLALEDVMLNKKKQKGTKWLELEEALFKWFCQVSFLFSNKLVQKC
jgi:hypothetical protein